MASVTRVILSSRDFQNDSGEWASRTICNILKQQHAQHTIPSLSITNEAGDTCSLGDDGQPHAPEVAASDDDDGGGDSDGEPARRRPPFPKQPPATPPALFTFEQLRHYVALNRSRIYPLIREGQFPAPIKIGKSSRWLRSQIDAWIESRTPALKG